MLPDWIVSFISMTGVIVSLIGIGVGLDNIYPDDEKRAFVEKLNKRIKHAPHSTTSVFKAVFDALELILFRIFGPRVASFRFFFFTAVGSGLFFCAYLSLVISTGMRDITLVQRMFESRQSILTFFILSGFSLITDVLSIAQTRLFLRIFRSYPTGLTFLVFAYSDLILKITLFILVFPLGIMLSILAVDVNMEKAIPVAVYWRHVVPTPKQTDPNQPPFDRMTNFAITWPEVGEPAGYSDYQHPIHPIRARAGNHVTVRWHSPSLFVTDADSADKVIQKHFTGLKNIEFEKLTEVRRWPVDCVAETEHDCFHYTHMVYVHPFYDIAHFGPNMWAYGAATAYLTVASGQFVFFDPNQLYWNLCVAGTDETSGNILGDLVTSTNPKIIPVVPLSPFFVSGLFLSIIIYMLAFSFKFLAVLREGLGRFLKTKGFSVSERIPFTQASVVPVLVYLVFILAGIVGRS